MCLPSEDNHVVEMWLCLAGKLFYPGLFMNLRVKGKVGG